MINNNQILYQLEEFKIPYQDPFCPLDWKDWYHYILYDPITQIRILYNLCFNGKPGTGYITETIFITTPKGFTTETVCDFSKFETFGFARNLKWEKEVIASNPIHVESPWINFQIKHNRLTFLSTKHPQMDIFLDLEGYPLSAPIYVPELAPYGRGFMGWGVIPVYRMRGNLYINGIKIIINKHWICYHDRNFGRFSWGNIGWTWFSATIRTNRNQDWSFVLHQSNNNDYSKIGSPILFVYRRREMNKIFIGDTVSINIEWSEAISSPPILPGSMASVFCDRTILVPNIFTVTARDETDHLELTFNIETHVELIVPDNENKQYTYLKEYSGSMSAQINMSNELSMGKKGFFYAELVH